MAFAAELMVAGCTVLDAHRTRLHRSAIGTISALRESKVLFATIIGTPIYREKNKKIAAAIRIFSRIFTHSANRQRGTKVSVTARVVAGAIALAAVTSFANAQLSPQWQGCTGNPGIDWDQQIKSCTALIESGAEAKENVAIAFYNRALAYENKEDYERAIADYSKAIGLNPNDADAYFYRSLDRKRKGDNAGAEADMAAAKRINPNIGE
jgi:tetratricopeptide (TPR) repeat protein